MLIIYIVVAVVLIGVIRLLDRRTPPREPSLPAIRRMMAGEDRLTPQVRRKFAALATVFAAIAAGSWTLFAMGVGSRHWILELALLSSCVAVAGLVRLVASCLGERKTRGILAAVRLSGPYSPQLLTLKPG